MTWRCWEKLGWSEEQEQAECDARALKILTCRRGACRREKRCLGGVDDCPGEPPVSEEESTRRFLEFRAMLKETIEDDQAGKEVAAAAKAARAAADARREKLAFQRAREVLAEGQQGGGARSAGGRRALKR